MRRLLPFLFIVFAAGHAISAQAAPDAPELIRLLNEFLDGAGRGDAAVHDRFWADDLIYTRSAGTRTNKEELMKGVRSTTPAKSGDPVTLYTAEDVRVQQYGSTAVVAFRLVGTTTRTDGTKSVARYLNTGAFVKRKGKWQAVAWQATSVPTSKAESNAADQVKSSVLTTSSPGVSAQSPADNATKAYLRGSRGGCYYLSASGRKLYVDHSFCK